VDFVGGKIDVYTSAFAPTTARRLADSSIPTDMNPFIMAVHSNLYVAYAKVGDDGDVRPGKVSATSACSTRTACC
jgi:hypothetical protein